jgi:hypothetical protein
LVTLPFSGDDLERGWRRRAKQPWMRHTLFDSTIRRTGIQVAVRYRCAVVT